MYAGKIVEYGPVDDVLDRPLHPYTQGLLRSIPGENLAEKGQPLHQIPGSMPSLLSLPPGCAFAPRCALAKPDCFAERPPFTTSGGRGTACFRAAPSERSLP